MNFITDNWFQIATTIGVVIAWLLDKRKRRAESDEAQGNALGKMQEAYDKFVSDSNRKIDEYDSRVRKLEELLDEATQERAAMRERIDSFEQQSERDKLLIEELTRKVNLQQTTINSQKKRISELERQLKK